MREKERVKAETARKRKVEALVRSKKERSNDSELEREKGSGNKIIGEI